MDDQSEFIYGKNAVLAYLKTNSQLVDDKKPSQPAKIGINKILLASNFRTDARIQKIKDLASEQKIPIAICQRQKLDQLVGPNQAHQGVVASISAAEMWQLETLLEKLEADIAKRNLKNQSMAGYTIALLDGIEDPHNLGAIIRVAEGAGVEAVLISQRRSAQLTGTVAKISAGALATLPVVRVTNLVSSIEVLKKYGFWVVGTDCNAEKLYTDIKYDFPLVVVIGSEGKGLSRLVLEHCDFLVKIPMLGKVESLNASVSAGVLFYEVVRQNYQKN